MSGHPPVRLLISDVNGPLVRFDKRLADATVNAIRPLAAAGSQMGLISARPPSGMRKIVEKLGL